MANWFNVLALALQVVPALEADVAEIAAGQPATSPAIDVTIGGKKYSVVVTVTPPAA